MFPAKTNFKFHLEVIKNSPCLEYIFQTDYVPVSRLHIANITKAPVLHVYKLVPSRTFAKIGTVNPPKY